MYKYKFCSSYGYLCTSISSIILTGDLNKYKSAISTSMCPTGNLNKYKFAISTSMCHTGDMNKYKFVISTSTCISLLYEFLNNYVICYYIFVTVRCLLEMSISACVYV